MDKKNLPIAVFDSGVGGISVLRELIRCMPEENYLYFGDSANAPYGNRTTEEVKALTLNAAKMLYDRGIKALVVACNTATAAAIKVLRKTYPDLIVVGIEPALKLAADSFPGGNLGVLATEVTLREEKFDKLRSRFAEKCTVYKIPAPGVAKLIEAGKNDSPEMITLLQALLNPYVGKLDALVLGCTHYPFVSRRIGRVLGPETELLHGGKGTARETKRRLEQAGLLQEGPGQVQIISSDPNPDVTALAWKLLNG